VQGDQGIFDDTAMNGIGLFCTEPASLEVLKIIKSTEGSRGSWTGAKWCNFGYITSFSLRVQKPSWMGNTGANNIKFMCSDGSILEGDGMHWGEYGPWS
ncbi:hypothetical protein GDO81_026087, partial [Engystomops pustulosus]